MLMGMALCSQAALAQIGTVNFSMGDVRILRTGGITMPAPKGTQVNEGDTLLVGPVSSAQLKMVDGGVLALRPETQMKFDQYKWNGREDGSERGVLSLVRGGFRTITGAIGRINKNNLRVTTPTATVGIRGTDHEVLYVPAGSGAPVAEATPLPVLLALLPELFPVQSMSDVIDQPVLLAQAGPPGGGSVPSLVPPGTYDKVNVGAATITSQGVTVVVQPNQVGFAPPQATPRILPVMPPFLRATPPVRQAPAAQQAGTSSSPAGAGGGTSGSGTTGGSGTTSTASSGSGDSGGTGTGGTGSTGGTGGTTASSDSPAVRSTSTVDNSSQMAAASSTAVQSSNTTPTGTTTVVSPTPTTTTGTGSGTSSGGTTTTTTTSAVPVVLTSSSGTTANLTTQTTSNSSGTTTSINQGSQTATQAATAAAAAVTAANSLSTLVTNSGVLASQTLGTPASVTAAQNAFTTASALTINSAGLSSSVASAASTATAAAATQSAAASVYAANGTFADPAIATPALTAMNAANTLVQSNNALVSGVTNTVTTEQATFTSRLASGTTVNNNITSTLAGITTAGNTLSTLGLPPSSTASSLLATAQNAATAAQAAAAQALSFQNAGNQTQADAQLLVAQQQQTIAQNALAGATALLSGVAAANSAVALAGTVSDTAASSTLYGHANAATAAVTNSNTAIAQTNAATTTPAPTPANIVQTQAGIVSAQAPRAQYSNPAWVNPPASTPRGMSFVSGGRPVTGGIEGVAFDQEKQATNVSYVLDQNKNLVTVRNSTDVAALGVGAAVSPQNKVISSGAGTPSVNQTNASATITGATAGSEGVYVSADKTINMGRWTGGQVDVNGVANVIPMGTGGLVWGLGLEPVLPGIARTSAGLLADNAFVHYPQQIIGTVNFTKAYNTTPFDASGATGTLTSAALSANFTSQTADASVGVSFTGARTSTLSGSVTGVPITQSGFDATPTNGYAPTVTCTGTCATGYVGTISGGFTGTSTVSGAMLNYNLRSNETSGLYGDMVSGAVAFTANSTPAVGLNLPNFPSSTSLSHTLFYPVTAADSTLYAASINNGAAGVTSPNTNYLFDGIGNLVRIQETPYTLFDTGAAATPANVAVPATTNNAANHPVSISFGGTAAENFNASASTGVRFGRYAGGKVTISDLANNLTYFDNLGSGSLLWAVGRYVPAANLTSLTGQWHYTRLNDVLGNAGFATFPADNWGNTGVLYGARLEVNFNTLTVNPGLRIALANTGSGGSGGGVTLSAYAEDVPISSGSFNVHTSDSNPLRLGCQGAGCTPNWGGRITGNLTSIAAAGTTADGALMRYSFGNSSTQQISGLVALGKGPQLTVPTNWGSSVSTSYYYWNNTPKTYGTNEVFQGDSFQGPKVVSAFGGPNTNLSAVSEGDRSLTIGGNTAGASSVTITGNDISFGRYASGSTQINTGGSALTLTGQNGNVNFTTTPREVLGSFQWISAPNIWPIFASTIIPGTATYVMSGASDPTDQNNVTGTLNSASLFVNFNQQFVNTAFNVSMPAANSSLARTWVATANGVRLDDSGGFVAGGNSGVYAHNAMTVTLNGNPSGFGTVQGQLSGALMNGATLAYTLAGTDATNSGSHEHVNGVIAFGTPTFTGSPTGSAPDALQPMQVLLRARGTVAGINASTGIQSTTAAAALSDEYLTTTRILAVNPTRTKFDANGGLTEFDGQFVAVSGTCPGTTCQANEFPVRLGINAASSAAAGAIPAMPAITGTAAVIAESGSDVASGLRWGRYSNGDFAVVDRVNGASVGTGNLNQGLINHYLISSVQSGPTVLPTTGTFTYTLVGGTSPTDSTGGVGTLNSASLVANFGTQKVDVAVNATVSGRTWNASANAVNILAGTGFEASKSISGGGPLSVTCTGTGCGASAVGKISGAFTGPTGTAAGIAYSLNTGAGINNAGNLPVNGGISMGGVAAFKR
jgi:hypothetical protein